MTRMKPGTIVQSPVSQEEYRIDGFLGKGGFGSAYQVQPRYRKDGPLCLKVTWDDESWHREAYFGSLLKSCSRAIRVHESFPYVPPRKRREVHYCIVSELAEHGTVVNLFETRTRPWSPERARREVIGILRVLEGLHQTGAIHRDITPQNVLVCKGYKLKLGDFGIACHAFGNGPVDASAFNPKWVPTRIAQGLRNYWLPSDDVYQMGQLLHILLSGDSSGPVKLPEVKALESPEDLKRIIVKAIRSQGERYESAGEMLRDLAGDVGTICPPPESLRGLTVVLTGPLSIKRTDAEIRIRQNGGICSNHVTAKTNVLVQGGRSSLYLNGHKGTKLVQAEKLMKAGQKISIISESEFLSLLK